MLNKIAIEAFMTGLITGVAASEELEKDAEVNALVDGLTEGLAAPEEAETEEISAPMSKVRELIEKAAEASKPTPVMDKLSMYHDKKSKKKAKGKMKKMYA